jgi:hypothetical protein
VPDEWPLAFRPSADRGYLNLAAVPQSSRSTPSFFNSLLGHTKIENTVRYLGVDVEDALTLAEATEV